MRTIKFKAKRVDNGEWVFGSLIQTTNPHKVEDEYWAAFIHEGPNISTPVHVIPETVCQFTGLLNKNGVEIYEGDILSNINHYEDDKPYYSMHKVLHSDEYTGWVCINLANKTDDLKTNGNCQLWVYLKNSDCEITGNIHDK